MGRLSVFLSEYAPFCPDSTLFCPDSLGKFLHVLIPEIYGQIIGFFVRICPILSRFHVILSRFFGPFSTCPNSCDLWADYRFFWSEYAPFCPDSTIFCPDSLGHFLHVLIPEIYGQIIGFFG